jgi:hypothetical protein
MLAPRGGLLIDIASSAGQMTLHMLLGRCIDHNEASAGLDLQSVELGSPNFIAKSHFGVDINRQ